MSVVLEKELPKNWVLAKIDDITDVIRGASPRPKGDPKYFGGNIPWIMISDISKAKGTFITQTRDHVTEAGAKKSRLVKKGCLILSNSGTVCVPKILGVDGCIHDGFVTFPMLESHTEILYAYYWFEYIRPKIIRENKQGITQVNLNTSIVRNIDIPLPPLNEQKRIIAKIEELFSLVDSVKENLVKTKLLLKQYRQSILKHAFEGKLVPQDPNDEPASVLLEKIKKEKPSQKTSNIVLEKELPKGWVECSLNEITLQINSGFPSGRHNMDHHGIPHIRPMNINENGEIDLTILKYVIVDNYDRLQKGDVLFNNTNSPKLLGKTSIIKDDTNWAYSNHMTRIRFDLDFIESKFIAIYLHKLFLEGYYKIRATNHVNQSSITGKYLSSKIPVPLPPLNEQKRIVAKIEESLSIIEKNEKLVDSLLLQYSQIKNSILKQAFKGKLVPQDPNDEPAQILLEKIQQERKKNGK